jgi:hypothetical protein
MKKDLFVMFMLSLSTLLFFYIPQFSARCREYVGEIYELEYYFFISFSLFFLFFSILYQLPGLFVILSKYIHMRSCFEGFIKRNPMM